MSKAQRIRQQNAREKIAAQQAAARRADRRKRYLAAGGSIGAVIVIVIVLVVVKLNGGSTPSPSPKGSTSVTGVTQPASVVNEITHVPASTLNTVGTGTTYPKAVQNISPAVNLLTQGGKPVMIYVGAEYCPYCAAERWAMTIALSRFGTFSHLHFIHSSSTDVNPSTPTLTFYKATYTSNYLTFIHTEAQTITRATLEKPTKLETSVMGKYDVPPYVPSSQYDGSFPFVDFGNKYVIDGASYNPQILHGMTWAQVAAALANPSSPVAKGADGAANLITAAICKMTGGKPGNVCTSPGVTTASGSI